MPPIVLITDYGTRDHYVGALKGAILTVAPSASIVDVTHDIEPHNVRHAGFVLRQVWDSFPPDTIYVAVVDPGVGTHRRILLARYAGRSVIAPDNGLVTFLHQELPLEAARVVENPMYFTANASTTFHGRDIFAPVAAHLSNGVASGEFGPATDRVELLPVSYRAEVLGGVVRGVVLHVDRFGTFVTNIARDQLDDAAAAVGLREVFLGDVSVGPIRSTFADVAAGEPVALIGGGGLLEIAVNRGRAVDRFGSADSLTVEVR